MANTDSGLTYEFSNQYLYPDFPSKYREAYMTFLKDSEISVIKTIQELFQSGKYKGERMIEVGCGPTIHRLAILSKYYDDIITSDYAPENKKNVEKWIAGDPDALDWTPLLEVIAGNEGYSDIPSGVKNIEERIRQKVKSVIHCDVLKKSIFEPEIKEADLLFTSACLESACPSLDSFAAAVKNLGSYVKPGGYIMIFTATGMSTVDFFGKNFQVLNVDENFVCSSVKDAGFVEDWRWFRDNDIHTLEFSGLFILIAKKL